MAGYARLLAIVVTHEYCGAMPLQLRFVPDAACAALMQREGLLLRHTPDGAEVWRDATADRLAAALPLSFLVFADDPHLRACTEWPVALPLRYVSVDADEVLRPETLAGALHAPLLSIGIAPMAAANRIPAASSVASRSTMVNFLAARLPEKKYFQCIFLAASAMR